MQVEMKYRSRSAITSTSSTARLLQLAPNLARDQVAFDATLSDPLAFREAISALHDVVINDLRFQPRDKTAYQQWQVEQRQLESQIRQAAIKEKSDDIAAGRVDKPSKELTKEHAAALKQYWAARRSMNTRLRKENAELWRSLMPYDPIITIAEDVVFFECYSVDQSSYGCLTVQRDGGFGESGSTTFGTTNVDYSWGLYDSFQTLRTYRETRFQIDPDAFSVTTSGDGSDHTEEKIELPDGWLRAFVQMQSAMAIPAKRVSLSIGSMYSLLAFLRRNKAKTSPRAIRFELADGQHPKMVLEPWEQTIESHGTRFEGPTSQIRVWGRRRLLSLARVLPLAERVDVYLLGTGLPSFWVVKMGPMRLTLGLSGWTANDWSAGSAVSMLVPSETADAALVATLAKGLSLQRSASLQTLASQSRSSPDATIAGLNELALRGQVIYDLDAGLYRWRSMLPIELSDREIGPPHEEWVAAKELMGAGKVNIATQAVGPRGGTVVVGQVENQPCEVMIDGDGMVTRGKCRCSWHFKFGVRNGPCRHLQALRDTVWHPRTTVTLQ